MRIDADWTYRGLRAVVLETRHLRVVVLPEVGGRIWSVVDKRRDAELIWQNPRVAPRKVAFAAGYDDAWCGGWEELFPNDSPAVIGGESFPDHGETWAIEWDWQRDADSLVLGCCTPISGMRLEKRIRLDEENAALEVDYRIENPTLVSLPFLFKLHLALAVRPGCRLSYPAGMSIALEPEFPGTLRTPEDALIRETPPPDRRELHFFYGSGYTEGRFSVQNPEGGTVSLDFDAARLPSLWIFAAYRGWRDHYVLVAEPATCQPMHLERAIERRLAPVLRPGSTFETSVRLSCGI